MKFTLSKEEAQTLIAKAMGVDASSVKLTVKDLAVEVAQDVSNLSFITVPAAVAIPVEAEEVAEETTEEVAPKAKAKAKTKAKTPVVEEEIEDEVDEEEVEDDDIDFL